MEALLVLLVELVTAALTVVLPLIVEVVFLMAQAIGLLVAEGIALLRRRAVVSDDATDQSIKRKPVIENPRVRKFAKWSTLTAGGLFFLTLTVFAVANLFFFESIVRWQLDRVATKTGIDIQFESADGSLWTGKIQLNKVHFQRDDHPASTFNLNADHFMVDLSVTELFFRKAVIEDVSIDSLAGTFERIGVPETLRPRKDFRAQRVSISNSKLMVIDHTRNAGPVEMPLTIESLVSEPFRSPYAVFDVLFRSNLKGTFGGRPIAISTTVLPNDGRETHWDFDRLPIELARPYVGGPMRWISHGELDLHASDRWEHGKPTSEIEMHYDIVLHDIQAAVPEDSSKFGAIFAKPIVALLNKHPKRFPISFDLVLKEEEFKFNASPLASHLFKDIDEALKKAFAQKVTEKKEGVTQSVKDRAKSFFDKFGNNDEQATEENEDGTAK